MARHITPEWLNRQTWTGHMTPSTQEVLQNIQRRFGSGCSPTAQALFYEGRFEPPPFHNKEQYAVLSNKCRKSRNGDLLRSVGPNGPYNDGNDPEVGAARKAQAEGRDLVSPQEDAKILTKYYPHLPRVFMLAPLHLDYGFLEAKANSQTPGEVPLLARALGVDLVRDKILNELQYIDIANLFRTSSGIATAVDAYFVLWDASEGDYRGASHTEQEIAALQKAGETPSRWSARGARTLMIAETTGPWSSSLQRRKDTSYAYLAGSTIRMWRAIQLQGITIRRLALINVPFLDMKGLAAMVGACVNLTIVDVARCDLIHHYDMAQFLRKIQRLQRQRGRHIHCDIAPNFERGSPYADFIPTEYGDGESQRWRKGTFGVIFNDAGIKIPVAVATWLIYHGTLDAMQDADQMHMLRYESLFRQWVESLPAPTMFIPRIISLWCSRRKLRIKMAAAENDFLCKWFSENLFSQNNYPGFGYENWSQELRAQEAEHRVWYNFALASAMFGDERWAETKDRSACRSGDFQCGISNWLRWANAWPCHVCRQDNMPRMMFVTGATCEACKLKRYMMDNELDHLKPAKMKVAEALGFSDYFEWQDLAKSMIPPLSYYSRLDDKGKLQSVLDNTRFDDVRVFTSYLGLRSFFKAAHRLDLLDRETHKEVDSKWRRTTYVQSDNDLGEYEVRNRDVWDAVSYSAYRRSQSMEEFMEKCADPQKGWTPSDGVRLYGFW